MAAENHIYTGDIKDKAVSTSSLNTRIDINKKYQSKNFEQWLFKRLNVVPGEHVLDVGCGTGAQSLRFLDMIGAQGSVSAIDLSQASVEQLISTSSSDSRLTAVAEDMANLEGVIKGRFPQKKYTLAHSSYALYYSPARMDVLRLMAESIHEFGRLAVFTPVSPHGMVDIASRFSTIPAPVLESLEFGPNVLEPAFRSLFFEVEIHYFQSEMRVTSLMDFMDFYKATTYYDKNAENDISCYAEERMAKDGAVSYEKNGFLIIGREKRRNLA
jgi:SAM-dependent methyltransferase